MLQIICLSLALSRSNVLIGLGILALILLIFNPSLLFGAIRWCIFIVVATLAIVIKNVIDPYEVFVGMILSEASWVFELLGGIESIAVDSLIVFLTGKFILPKNYLSWIVVVLGGGMVCTWNLFHCFCFSFMPIGWDASASQEINWPFNLIYMAVYALTAWLFFNNERPKEELEAV